ncbi:MAG: helix-turn-helix domain-containing protein [Dehalobacterium sp.]
MAQVERELIMNALTKYENNRSKAIRELGISRRAFYEKIHKYQIDVG